MAYFFIETCVSHKLPRLPVFPDHLSSDNQFLSHCEKSLQYYCVRRTLPIYLESAFENHNWLASKVTQQRL